jgi:uncharacterized membrane protein
VRAAGNAMPNLAINHARLWIAVAVAIAIFFVWPHQWSAVSRILLCWNCGVVLFLVLLYSKMTRLSADDMCARFIEEDETAPVILFFAVLAALLSLVAIVDILSTLKQSTGAVRGAHLVLAAVTVASSWTLVPTLFTMHYADMFYSVVPPAERPLHFPRTLQPLFWDFAYFSFTIAAACQTADVATNDRAVRKVVIAQTVISFVFNAAVLGFAINVTAGLIGGN